MPNENLIIIIIIITTDYLTDKVALYLFKNCISQCECRRIE